MRNPGVVAFAFGLPGTIRPNAVIAAVAYRKSIETSAPIFTQSGIDLPQGAIATYMEEAVPGSPTLRIARAAIAWAVGSHIKLLWVASATPHTARVLRDLELACVEARTQVQIRRCEETGVRTNDEWFCMDSTQPRTRTKAAWEQRETILMKLPVWLYKRIAS